jgi:predicted nucleic acid-binding protein
VSLSIVLVDSSIWIEFFKKSDTPVSSHLDELLSLGKVVTTGAIRAEITSGAKSLKEFDQLRDYFSALIQLPDPKDMWSRVEQFRFRLRRKGHSVSLIDLIIALAALDYEAAIWSADRDFEVIQKELPIELYQYPQLKKA